MSRRKDRERYLQRKERNADYIGYRGADTVIEKPPAPVESVVCSSCGRKRNVPRDTIPTDRDSYVCLRCQGTEANSPEEARV